MSTAVDDQIKDAIKLRDFAMQREAELGAEVAGKRKLLIDSGIEPSGLDSMLGHTPKEVAALTSAMQRTTLPVPVCEVADHGFCEDDFFTQSCEDPKTCGKKHVSSTAEQDIVLCAARDRHEAVEKKKKHNEAVKLLM